MSDLINIQQFLQWIVAGGISLIAMLAGLKHGLKGVEDKLQRFEVDMKEEFKGLKVELDKMKENQHTAQQKVVLLEYRVDALEKSKNTANLEKLEQLEKKFDKLVKNE